jgi:hypothetical protein
MKIHIMKTEMEVDNLVVRLTITWLGSTYIVLESTCTCSCS